MNHFHCSNHLIKLNSNFVFSNATLRGKVTSNVAMGPRFLLLGFVDTLEQLLVCQQQLPPVLERVPVFIISIIATYYYINVYLHV